jgi:hypothetical protein
VRRKTPHPSQSRATPRRTQESNGRSADMQQMHTPNTTKAACWHHAGISCMPHFCTTPHRQSFTDTYGCTAAGDAAHPPVQGAHSPQRGLPALRCCIPYIQGCRPTVPRRWTELGKHHIKKYSNAALNTSPTPPNNMPATADASQQAPGDKYKVDSTFGRLPYSTPACMFNFREPPCHRTASLSNPPN